MKRRILHLARLGVDVGAALFDESPDDRQLALPAGEVKRHPPVGALGRSRVSAARDEKPHDLQMLVVARRQQRRGAPRVAHVDVRASAHQRPRNVDVAMLARCVQRARAVVILRIHVCTVAYQEVDARGVAVVARDVQARHLVRARRVDVEDALRQKKRHELVVPTPGSKVQAVPLEVGDLTQDANAAHSNEQLDVV